MKKLATIALAATLPLLSHAASSVNLGAGSYNINFSGAGNLVASQQIGFESTTIFPATVDGQENYSLSGSPDERTQVSYYLLPGNLTKAQQYSKLGTAPSCFIVLDNNPNAQPGSKMPFRITVEAVHGASCSIGADGTIDMSS